MTLCALCGRFGFSCNSYALIMSLPLDPAECPWTPEGQAFDEERAHRAYLLRLAAMEEQQEIYALRRSATSR